MKLQQTIKRILREESILRFIPRMFDSVFDKLDLHIYVPDQKFPDTIYGKWYDEKNEPVFTRNNWGTLWIEKCEPYIELRMYSKLLSLNINDFELVLINYLNDKYKDKFKGKLIKSIGDEGVCIEEESEENLQESEKSQRPIKIEPIQKLVDSIIKSMKNTCEIMDSEDEEILSFSVCELISANIKVSVSDVSIVNDRIRVLINITYKNFRWLSEDNFLFELSRELKKWIGPNYVEVDEYTNTFPPEERQW